MSTWRMDGEMCVIESKHAVQAGKKPEGWNLELPVWFSGKNLDEIAERCGKDTITKIVKQSLWIKFRMSAENLALCGRTDEEIRYRMEIWKPGRPRNIGRDPLAVLQENIGNLTPEQKAQMIEQLKSSLNPA